MTREQIERLASNLSFKHIVETHMSWVIVSDEFAYKIKKPVRLNFADFSSIARRHKYCNIEFHINQKWSDIYVGVSPVIEDHDSFRISSEKGKVVDYAVVMRRMDEGLKMDFLLSGNQVTIEQVRSIATAIAEVHSTSAVIVRPFSYSFAKTLFDDLHSFVFRERDIIPPEYQKITRQSTFWSQAFLKANQQRFQERVAAGFQREGHGDLHAGNIFLTENPVIFDCLEFETRLRQNDILYDVAFLAMDLDSWGRSDLSDGFIQRYRDSIDCMPDQQDDELLNYFKCLRANIRAKVHLIQANQSGDIDNRRWHIGEACRYLKTIESYTTR